MSLYYSSRMVTQNYSVRLEPEIVTRLDRLAEAMSRELAGVKVNRTQTLRMAIELGLAQAESKFGITRAKRSK